VSGSTANVSRSVRHLDHRMKPLFEVCLGTAASVGELATPATLRQVRIAEGFGVAFAGASQNLSRLFQNEIPLVSADFISTQFQLGGHGRRRAKTA